MLLLAILTLFSIVVFVFLVTYAAQRLMYPRMAIGDVARYPIVAVLGELLAELLVLVGMISMVKEKGGQAFGRRSVGIGPETGQDIYSRA